MCRSASCTPRAAAPSARFKTTEDVSKYTKAALFQPGAETEMLIRFSSVAGEQGSPDTWRDPRGFAVKFYTTEGNYDLVGNNTPVFFIRDGIKFPDFIHSQKRLPGTHLRDADMQWDFWTLSPESAHQVTWLMGDRGLPASWREMQGYGSHTYQWINAEGERFWVKYHFKSNQGVKSMTGDEAEALAGADADFYIRDLQENIAAGNFPSWDLHVQVMPYEDAKTYRFNPFDLTKVWPHADYPLIKVGTMELNRNPENYFAQIEQATFAPSNFVPGIAASPDKMLQARIFSYADAHRYRVGTNHAQLPVNAPKNQVNNYSQDGAGRYHFNAPSVPVYAPNSVGGPAAVEPARCRRRLGERRRADALRALPARRGRRLRPGRHAVPRGVRRRREGPPAGDRHRCRQRRQERRASRNAPSSTGRTSTPSSAPSCAPTWVPARSSPTPRPPTRSDRPVASPVA